jgi:hypothetical protein
VVTVVITNCGYRGKRRRRIVALDGLIIALLIITMGFNFFFVHVPPDVISLQIVPPKLLVYNSSYTPSIIYI